VGVKSYCTLSRSMTHTHTHTSAHPRTLSRTTLDEEAARGIDLDRGTYTKVSVLTKINNGLCMLRVVTVLSAGVGLGRGGTENPCTVPRRRLGVLY